jgi:hypothetical protein
MKRLAIWGSLSSLGLALLFAPCGTAQQTDPNNAKLVEPVLRISKNDAAKPLINEPNALDPALDLARRGLLKVREDVQDYTAVLVKREQVGGELGEYEFMFAKIRNRKVVDGEIKIPFSVYLMFLKPSAIKGREVLYVENQNDGKMVAHESGIKRMLGTHHLDPNSWIAMQGQRYPLTEIGIENLMVKLLERGERYKSHGTCEVEFLEGAKVSGRECKVLQVKTPHPAAHYDFCMAQIFVDKELDIPVRYAAYDWPAEEGGQMQVLEEYTYQQLKLNVGLTDEDFDINNPQYNFHK